jgi:hypothetical protein
MEDLFGQPVVEKPKRETSKADDEKRRRVSYQRRTRFGPHAGCHDCIHDPHKVGIEPAAYTRSEGDAHTPLCYQHKQQRQDEERLTELRSGSN